MKTIIRTTGIAAAAAGAFLVAGTGVASASTINGTLTTVTSDNASTTPLVAGNSDTKFGVNLQASPSANGKADPGANCSADSATGSTLVYTYLIHSGENPLNLDLTQGEPGMLPDGSAVGVLADTGGAFETNSTDAQTASGTGQILLPPGVADQWTSLVNLGFPATGSTGLLYQNDNTTGSWLLGYACFKAGNPGTVTDYWQTPITFTANPLVGGSEGFVWTTASTTSTGPGSVVPEAALPILLPLGGAALVIGGVAFGRRRSRKAAV